MSNLNPKFYRAPWPVLLLLVLLLNPGFAAPKIAMHMWQGFSPDEHHRLQYLYINILPTNSFFSQVTPTDLFVEIFDTRQKALFNNRFRIPGNAGRTGQVSLRIPLSLPAGEYVVRLRCASTETSELFLGEELIFVSDIRMVSDLFIAGIANRNDAVLPFPAIFTKTELHRLSYYLQIVSTQNISRFSGTVYLIKPDGTQQVLNTIRYKGTSVINGEIAIADLPPGNYKIKAILHAGGEQPTIQRQFAFDVREQYPPISEADLYSVIEDIRTVFGEEVANGLVAEVRRSPQTAFQKFWQSLDTPDAEKIFYRRLAYAKDKFWLGSPSKGRLSDRGRVYLRYGAPDKVLHKVDPLTSNTLEIWRYPQFRRDFVFKNAAPVNRFDLVMLVRN